MTSLSHSAVPSAPPINVTVSNVAPGVVSLQWLPPPLENQNGEITGYVLQITDLELPMKTEEVELDDVTTSAVKRGLKTAHLYNFNVAAVTEKGRGPFSHTISIHTLHDGKTAIFWL